MNSLKYGKIFAPRETSRTVSLGANISPYFPENMKYYYNTRSYSIMISMKLYMEQYMLFSSWNLINGCDNYGSWKRNLDGIRPCIYTWRSILLLFISHIITIIHMTYIKYSIHKQFKFIVIYKYDFSLLLFQIWMCSIVIK